MTLKEDVDQHILNGKPNNYKLFLLYFIVRTNIQKYTSFTVKHNLCGAFSLSVFKFFSNNIKLFQVEINRSYIYRVV